MLKTGPQVTMDDGADLISQLHGENNAGTSLLKNVIGGTEETTTGVIRLRAMEKDGVLAFPDHRGQRRRHQAPLRQPLRHRPVHASTASCARPTCSSPGKIVVVAGYGMCGRGVASRAHGMGAHVIVTETAPMRALEAVMDGYQVMPMSRAAEVGDIFVTVTGNMAVIRQEHFVKMKDGAIVANSGHFNVEIDLEALAKLAQSRRAVRPFVEEFSLRGGRRVYVLGEGRLINLAAAEGHPAIVMDMSFANQALSAEYMVKHGKTPGEEGVRGAARHRPGDRAAQARIDGRPDRRAHARAGGVPLLLDPRHLAAPGRIRLDAPGAVAAPGGGGSRWRTDGALPGSASGS